MMVDFDSERQESERKLSQIEISGELPATLFGVGASGTVTITYTKQKTTP